MARIIKLLRNPYLNVALALAILGVIFAFADTGTIFHNLTWSSFAKFGAAILCAFASIFFATYRHLLLVRPFRLLPLNSYFLHANFLGFLYNYTLPTGLGGEAFRYAFFEPWLDHTVNLRTLFADRVLGVLTLFVLGSTSIFFLNIGSLLTKPQIYALYAIGVVAAIISISYAFYTALKKKKEELDATASARVAANYAGSVLSSFVFAALNILAFLACLSAAGFAGNYVLAFFCVPAILILQQIPLTVGGWGTREGAALLILPIAGSSANTAIAGSVAFGLSCIAAASLGAVISHRSALPAPSKQSLDGANP